MVTRRDFLKAALIQTISLSLWRCERRALEARKGNLGLFMEDGRPLLISVKGKRPEEMLEAAFDLLGGLEELVKGKRVLLKPNFVFPQPYPVTTDPDVIFATARLLRDAGAKEVEVFDAPGTFLIGTEKETFNYNRIVERAKVEGVRVVIGDAAQRVQYVKTRRKGWRAYPEIVVHRKVCEAPVIINMPCLKRHHTSYLTCALKNNFGAIYGAQRWDAHLRGEGLKKMGKGARERAMAPFRNRSHFMRALAEFADAVRPELSIVDARVILTRGGPTRGKGELKGGVNRIIVSADMVALDRYCSSLMERYDESYTNEMILPYLQEAVRLGLGTMELKNVKIVEKEV